MLFNHRVAFGLACLLSPAFFAGVARAASLHTIYSFSGTGALGYGPFADLIYFGGGIYGTTGYGGKYGTNDGGGTVYRMTTNGVGSLLWSFANGSDGVSPFAGVTDVKGTLYGTTQAGGAYFVGTVFKLTKSGVETVLHSFSGHSDGASPNASLINVAGTLYGTTTYGGMYNGGTVFTITPRGDQHVIYYFGVNKTDGLYPYANLVDADGTLFGTTQQGGTHRDGTVFKITPQGAEQVVHSFGSGGSDGLNPVAPLLNVSGTLYGTTESGGKHGYGTVFSVSTAGVETIVYSFLANGTDAHTPVADLISVSGTLYGTTKNGGAYDHGTVYMVTPSGAETVLYAFSGGQDGDAPVAGLIDIGGELFGTTSGGGAYGYGSVFELNP